MSLNTLSILSEQIKLSAAFAWLSIDQHSAWIEMQHDENASSCEEQGLGEANAMQRFVSLSRFSPFWTRAVWGQSVSEIAPETLFLLMQQSDDCFTLLIPILDARSRYSLRSRGGKLAVVAETGDPALPCQTGVALYAATGNDPYALIKTAAERIAERLRSLGLPCALRSEKQAPPFIDYFGWCTWDAFYKDVTPQKVLQGLESFKAQGMEPRFLILDDGWQQRALGDCGEEMLTSLQAHEGFAGSLANLARQVKQDFQIEHFFVWHALMGYWGGLSSTAFARFQLQATPKRFGTGILEQEPSWNAQPWGSQIHVPSPQHWDDFFQAWHEDLARQGIDGVKVDAQALLEAVSARQGGRVAAAHRARQALEKSVSDHFAGQMIHCMSCSQEHLYLNAQHPVMRTSDDFFPDRPESHGAHIAANTFASFWMGQFILPDWDMFHSKHPQAAFHAAARAISGGPVYVSDAPGRTDAALLRQLVLLDGRVLRCDQTAQPCPSSLFTNPLQSQQALKIFNRNGACGVVGLFNLHSSGENIFARSELSDVPSLPKNQRYIAWARSANQFWQPEQEPAPHFELPPLSSELVTYAPLQNGLAVIGLACKLNSSNAIISVAYPADSALVLMKNGGEFLAWSEKKPLGVTCDGQTCQFSYDPLTHALRAQLPNLKNSQPHLSVSILIDN